MAGDTEVGTECDLVVGNSVPADDSVAIVGNSVPADDSVAIVGNSVPADDSAAIVGNTERADDSAAIVGNPELADDSAAIVGNPVSVEGGDMPLTDHLAELRRRIIVCLLFWSVGCCVVYSFAPKLLEAIRGLAGGDFYFVFTRPTEAFMAFIKIAMVGSLFFCLPIFIYHIVAFVCPGLTVRERKWMLRLVPFSLVLFCTGELFAWFIALPIMWRFFLGFQSEGIRALWSIGDVVGFVLGALILCGLLFQTPLVLIFLAALGIVSTAMLTRARRAIYFGSFVAAAVITPTPDAFTAMVVAVPLIVFFEISLLIIKMLGLGKTEALPEPQA